MSLVSRLFTMFFTVICLTATEGAARDHSNEAASFVLEIKDLTSGGNEVATRLDLTALQAMETTEVVTSTIWTKGVHRFEGVPLTSLLSSLRLQGDRLRVTALNDYSAEIPLDDDLAAGALLAYRMDGQLMARRGKGPLWIIYPFDQSSKYRSETIYARSVWQLNRIQVID